MQQCQQLQEHKRVKSVFLTKVKNAELNIHCASWDCTEHAIIKRFYQTVEEKKLENRKESESDSCSKCLLFLE